MMISKRLKTVAFAGLFMCSLTCSDTFAQQARITHTPNGPVLVQPQMVVPTSPRIPQYVAPPQSMRMPQAIPQNGWPQPGYQYPPQTPPNNVTPPNGVIMPNNGVIPTNGVAPQNGLVFDRMRGGWVSPNTFNGVNNQTGGIDTYNQQVMDSTFQPGREQSKYNGTRRWERRPVYGPNGAVTGYQEGYVWRNTYTGQEHHNMNSFTPNNQGGVHKQNHTIQGKPGTDMPRPKT